MDRDRNLLFGMLAVQLSKVTPDQLVQVAAAWMEDPHQDIASRLVDAGILTAVDRDMLEGFVEQAVRAHAGNARQTIQSLGGPGEVRRTFGTDGVAALMAASTVPGPPPLSTPRPPELLDVPAVEEAPGRYSQISEHARGGMGRVLLVHDQHLGRDVALKELLPDPEAATTDGVSPVRQSMSHMTRFLREARVTGQLEHPAIVPVYELGVRHDGTLYYTMRLVRGRTFAAALSDARGLEGRLALLGHLLDLCHAIAYAHSRGVIHRDIKPHNVMVGEFGETVVLDWGLAKVKGREDVAEDEMRKTLQSLHLGHAAAPHTATGQAIGTPHYMPPEQARGELHKVDERSDVYALGTVLYELLTGRPPYTGKSTAEVVRRAALAELTPVEELEPEAPPELVAICSRAMQVEPAARYRSARELANDLQRFLSGAMVGAYSYSFAEHLRRFARRYRAVLTTAAAALFALMAVSAYAYVRVTLERNAAIHAWRGEQAARAREEKENYRAHTVLARAAVEDHQYAVAEQALAAAPARLRGWEWGYLQRLCRLNEATLAGHTAAVTSAAFSPDGAHIATASPDGTVRLWRTGSDQPVAVTPVPGTEHLAFSPDGTFVAATADEGSVHVIDVPSGKLRIVLEGDRGSPRAVAVSPASDRVMACAQNGIAHVWSVADGRLLATLQAAPESPAHSLPLLACAFSPDGTRAVTGTMSHSAIVWDIATGAALATLGGLEGNVDAVACSPDGATVAAAGGGIAKLWDAATFKERATLSAHRRPIFRLAYSPNSSLVALASLDATATVWDTRTGQRVADLSGHTGGVSDVAFSPDGQRLLTASTDTTVLLWDTQTWARRSVLAGHNKPISVASFSPDGRRVLTASHDATAKLWNVAGPELPERAVLAYHGDVVYEAAFSPNARRLATPSADGTVAVWDVETGERQAVLQGHEGSVWQAVFLPDNRRLLTVSEDGTARLWDATVGRQLAVFAGHEGPVYRAALSPGGAHAATASADGTVKIWSLATGAELHTLAGHSDTVRYLDYSPSGRRLVTAGYDGVAKVWDASTGAELFALEGHENRLNVARFSPDGRRIVTAARDATARIWDAETGALLFVLSGHGRNVVSASFGVAAFSPDGDRLVTSSADYTARVWDVATGRQLALLAGHTAGVIRAAFSPDGARILTAGSDGTARIWDAETGNEYAVLAGHAAELSDARFSPDGRLIATASWDNTARIWGGASSPRAQPARVARAEGSR